MKLFVIPTTSSVYRSNRKFTRGKEYAVLQEGYQRALVKDDRGNKVWVRTDGGASCRLKNNGVFNMIAKADFQGNYNAFNEAIKKVNAKEGGAGVIKVSGTAKFNAAESQRDALNGELEEIRKILRTPDGVSVVMQAKIVRELADALLKLQK